MMSKFSQSHKLNTTMNSSFIRDTKNESFFSGPTAGIMLQENGPSALRDPMSETMKIIESPVASIKKRRGRETPSHRPFQASHFSNVIAKSIDRHSKTSLDGAHKTPSMYNSILTVKDRLQAAEQLKQIP
jgi:hypothetical protein